MLTLTARKHIANALSDALRIFPSIAEEILARFENVRQLEKLVGPFHGVRVLICEASDTLGPTAHLYRNPGAEGYMPIGVIRLQPSDLDSWVWHYQDVASETAKEILANLFRDPLTGDAEPHWSHGEIFGYGSNDDYIDLDIKVDGQHVNAALFPTGAFAGDISRLAKYAESLMGCKTDVLLASQTDFKIGTVNRVIAVLPGGARVPALS